MNERRRSAFLNMFFGYAGVAISMARNVLLVPVYLANIPLTEYGAWLATGGALALILISDYGLAGVVTQRISAKYGAGELAALGQLSGSALAIGALLSVALTLLSLLVTPFLPGLAALSPQASHKVMECFLLAVAANALGVIGGTAGSVIRSLQRVTLAGAISLSAEAANVLTILLGLYLGLGLYSLALGLLLRALIITLGGFIGCWVVARAVGVRIEVTREAVIELFGEASRFFLSSISIKLLTQANVFFVGWILGAASAAVYSLTVRAHDTVTMLIILVSGSLVPSITHLYGSGNFARFRDVIERLLLLLAALTALTMALTVILNPAFLHLWVGDKAFAGQGVSALMAVALFVSLNGSVAYDALLAQGKFRLVSNLYLLSSSVQVAVLAVTLHWGLWGAPLATLAAASVFCFGFWRSLARDIDMRGREAVSIGLEVAKLAIVSVAGVIAFDRLYPRTESWWSLTLEAMIGALCLGAGYLFASRRLRRIVVQELDSSFRLLKAT